MQGLMYFFSEQWTFDQINNYEIFLFLDYPELFDTWSQFKIRYNNPGIDSLPAGEHQKVVISPYH